MTDPQITAELSADQATTPETDAVWDDKSRNILSHSKSLERQRDELAAELTAERTARKALSEALQGMMKAEMEARQSNGWGADEVEAEPHWMAARAALTTPAQ
jgi:hypothetical protein